MTVNKQVFETTLVDTYEGYPPTKVRITADNYGIYIWIEGYGHNQSDIHERIAIEQWLGTAQLVVWGDVNDDEPTHNINLDSAKTSKWKGC